MASLNLPLSYSAPRTFWICTLWCTEINQQLQDCQDQSTWPKRLWLINSSKRLTTETNKHCSKTQILEIISILIFPLGKLIFNWMREKVSPHQHAFYIRTLYFISVWVSRRYLFILKIITTDIIRKIIFFLKYSISKIILHQYYSIGGFRSWGIVDNII